MSERDNVVPFGNQGTAHTATTKSAILLPSDSGGDGRGGRQPPGGPPMNGDPSDPFVRQSDLARALDGLEKRLDARLSKLHSDTRMDLVIQTIAVVSLVLLIWYGTLQSNQQAGGLGISAGQIADEAADRATERVSEAIIEELRRQSDEREK